jgi:CelD/BcsL family acetyltransferase involved in cellulose biosynthesis
MDYAVSQESFDSLHTLWADSKHDLDWSHIFLLPPWLKVWWQKFGEGKELHLSTVREGEEVLGVAPLMLSNGQASIIGSTDVCDYLDFVAVPGRENDFFNVLLDDLKQKGVKRLALEALRPDSTTLTSLVAIAEGRGYEMVQQEADVSLELELPATWEDYFPVLNRKQRHELRRKLRRLEEAGKVDYLFTRNGDISGFMDTFLQMFSESRRDKAGFMTEQMETFFRAIAASMAEAGLLRLGSLELDGNPVAMILCFDYNDSLYLYNSGYDRQYQSLSVGLLSKVLCIKQSIEDGRRRFDFLKGNEIYKHHLGGKRIPLYNCQIDIV